LWRDYAEHSVAVAMNKNRLIEVNIITNSNWLQQLLWMSDLPNRRFETHMALYSLNSSILKFKTDAVVSAHPSIRHLSVDLIWIWDAFYAEVLFNEKVFCRTKVVAPILWYLPSGIPVRQSLQCRRICVFDVTPVTLQALIGRGLLGCYYNAETMKSFLDNVIAAAEDVKERLDCEIEIILKHKRKQTAASDQSYFDHVKLLCDNYSYLHLMEEDTNLFSLIADSDLIVVIPYSSPAYVANFLGIPALFYDPTCEILESYEASSPIRFTAGLENLKNEMMSVLELGNFSD